MYLCFGYDDYYPRGGMLDCYLATNDLKRAQTWIETQTNHFDHLYIYDVIKGKNCE